VRWLVATLVLLLLCPPAEAQGVIVRSSLDPASGAVVGEPVRLLVEVLFPGTMPRPPRVSIGDVAGAQVIRFETQAVTMRDQIQGQDYVGQRFEFVVFPRRGGVINIPSAEVTLIDGAGNSTGSAKGEPQSLAVTVPPGIDASGPVLAATEATARESWSPDRPTMMLKPGDAIKRTIERKAAGVPALGMADFQFTAPSGVRIYVDPPQVVDRMNRGEVSGARIDQATYVFEKPGSFALPSLDQPWWDLDAKQARNIPLPGLSVTVAAPSSSTANTVDPRRRWLAAILISGLLIGLGSLVVRRWRFQAAAYRNSETATRRALIEAAKAGDAADTYRHMTRWIAKLPRDLQAALVLDADLSSLRQQLERTLFGTGTTWSRQSGLDLSRAVEGASLHDSRRHVPAALPPLNPAQLQQEA